MMRIPSFFAAAFAASVLLLGACSSPQERLVGEWREQRDPGERIRFHPDALVTFSNPLGTVSGAYEVIGEERLRLRHPFGTVTRTFGFMGEQLYMVSETAPRDTTFYDRVAD